MRSRLVTTVLLCAGLAGCSSASSPAERFQLRAKCADEARAFEAKWKEENGTDFEVLLFRNHYNFGKGACYSLVYYGHPDLNVENVYDALSGTAQLPLVSLMGGNDKVANESAEHKEAKAKVREYMEEETP